jgi:hypothetical protein
MEGNSTMTTVVSPIHFDHLVQVVHHKACGRRAECWCGWASAWCDDYETADAAAQDHHEVVAGSATDFDATISGLLDLQDDLADALCWIADRWTPGLPTPYPVHRIERRADGGAVPALTLMMTCASTAELMAVARMLSTTSTPDPASWMAPRRVGRSFGRVRLEGYHNEAGGPID